MLIASTGCIMRNPPLVRHALASFLASMLVSSSLIAAAAQGLTIAPNPQIQVAYIKPPVTADAANPLGSRRRTHG